MLRIFQYYTEKELEEFKFLAKLYALQVLNTLKSNFPYSLRRLETRRYKVMPFQNDTELGFYFWVPIKKRYRYRQAVIFSVESTEEGTLEKFITVRLTLDRNIAYESRTYPMFWAVKMSCSSHMPEIRRHLHRSLAFLEQKDWA